ncbi:hypothetical protein WJX72_002992 [[Myrmecia] bisecta]|uniref:Uncharacterized protein n=1 Tax=[Myrmecia] bisecta TaxID=41462 RepID=A0AAW1PQ11_9CHLO
MERQLRDLDDLTDEVNTTYKHILTPRVTILDRATQTLKTRLNKLSDDFEDFKTASSDADDWSDFCDSYANSFSAYDSGFDNEDAPSCQSK